MNNTSVFRPCESPVCPFFLSADESCPFRPGLDLWEANLRREIHNPVSLVLAEYFWASSAPPHVYRPDHITVMDQVDHAVIDDVVLVLLLGLLQEGVSRLLSEIET